MRCFVQILFSLCLLLGLSNRNAPAAASGQPGIQAQHLSQGPAIQSTDFVQQVIELTNLERQKEGLGPLVANPLLSAAAQKHAEAMASGNFFDHNNPLTGTDPFERIIAEGYSGQRLAENIAAGDDTPQNVVAGWMNSPGHRINILTPEFTEIGAGYAFDANDSYPQAEQAYHHYWVQTFGTPTGASATLITPAQQPQISLVNQAIESGLAYLHQTMTRPDSNTGFWESAHPVGTTAFATLAFLNQGYLATGGTDPTYSDTVQRGLNYLLNTLQKQDIDPQSAGNPDTNGNGFGLYPDSDEVLYTTGIVLMALTSSGDPNQTATTGGNGVIGRTYVEIAQDIVDFIAWAQTEAEDHHRGGWHYDPNDGISDMSVTQWPVIGMGAAEINWQVEVPQWVKDEALTYVTGMQDIDGGFGYQQADDRKNIGKAGVGIQTLSWLGIPSSDARIARAKSYIEQNWESENDGWGHPGHLGNFYAMYAVTKGSRLAKPEITTYGVHNWYQEYINYLLANQAGDGSWNDQAWSTDDIPLSTAWALLMLNPVLPGAPVSTPGPTPAATLAPTPTIAGPPPTPVSSQWVTMTISVTPDKAPVGDAFTVQIRLIGDSKNCGQSVVKKPVDVILVLDHSDSMSGDPLEQAKVAAQAFIEEMDFTTDQVGVVQFNEKAQLLHPLSTDKVALSTVIGKLVGDDGTAIHEGLRVALETLQGSKRSQATPVIILLSDGQSDERAAQRMAETARAANIQIITVGLGGADEATLKSLASKNKEGEPQYYFAPKPAALKDIYISIAQNIREYGLGSNLTLRHQIDNYKFSIVPNSLSPTGQVIGSDTLAWEQSVLDTGETVFSFQVRGRTGGEHLIGKSTLAEFLECEQNPATLEIIDKPAVTVSDLPEEVKPISSPCAWWQTFPWWLLVPLLLMILFLIFLLLTPWGRRLRKKWLSKPIICKILSLLTLLYLLLLAAIFSRALMGDLCQLDQVYFWKISEGGDSVGVYVTQYGSTSSRPVTSLNGNSSCVACHVSNTTSQSLASVLDDQNGPIQLVAARGKTIAIPAANGSYIDYSPDGKKIIYSVNDQDLAILDLETGIQTLLAGASDPNIVETMPSWSPDGLTIAFVRAAQTADRTAEIVTPCDIYTVPAAGGAPLPLPGASEDGFNYYPAYSPDGKWLAFTRHTDGTTTYGEEKADIYLVPAMGGNPIMLRANSDFSDTWPSWSPDSRYLGFSSSRINGQFDIFLVEIASNGQSGDVWSLGAAISPSEEEFHPQWLTPVSLPWWQRLLALWPWLLLLPLLLFLQWLFCRTKKYLLYGQVRNSATSVPITGAEVKITQEQALTVFTDNDGHYSIRLPAGALTAVASAAGFLSHTRTDNFQSDTQMDFRLDPMVDIIDVFPVPPRLEKWEQPPIWQPVRALVIGLGGTGRYVLTQVKKNLLDAGAGRISDNVRLILLDTSDREIVAEETIPVTFAGVTLLPEDIVEFGEDIRPIKDAIVNDDTHRSEPEIRDWFPAYDYDRYLANAEFDLKRGTKQRRPMARAALVADVRKGVDKDGVEIVLAIDCSSSMNEQFERSKDSHTKLEAAQHAATQFIDQLDLKIDRVAVVSFNENAKIEQPLTNDRAKICNAILQLEADGNTAIHVGLQAARQALGALGEASPARAVIILSDGQSSRELAQAVAEDLKREGIQVISIGIGDVNAELMQSLATSVNGSPEYFFAPSASDLARLYISIARKIGTGSRLWRLIHGGAHSALDGDSLRVILVGSLCGGFGSAVLADVAYLARLAGEAVGAKTISIESYLATNGAFQRLPVNHDVLAVNTYATLRELERFQLATGWPFRMIYRYDAKGDPILAGVLKSRLLDQVYLFDTPPVLQPENEPQTRAYNDPAASVYAGMADAITLWLDRESKLGAVGTYRSTVERKVSDEQRAVGRAVVGGFGVYVYRLPVFDLSRLLAARWGAQVLRRFVMGDPTADLRLDPASNQEENAVEIAQHAGQFLLGLAGIDETICPAATCIIGRLAQDGFTADIKADLSKLEVGTEEVEAGAFAQYLSRGLRTILNGRKTSSVQKARCGKIGYALLFLQRVQEYLERAAHETSSHQSVLNETEVDCVAHLSRLISRYMSITTGFSENLASQAGLISQRLRMDAQSNGSEGLIEKLQMREDESRRNLEEMKSVLTRHYIIDEALLSRWYQDYFATPEAENEALGRLHWIEDARGQIVLAIRTTQDHPRWLEPGEPSAVAFIGDLLWLAGFYSQALWRNETLANVLSQTYLSSNQLDATASRLAVGARPMLNYDPLKATNAAEQWVLAANATVSLAGKLLEILKLKVPAERMVTRLETTDPFSLLTAQMVDVVPTAAIESLNQAEITYKSWYGLRPNMPADPRAEPTAVFRAERIALSLEQRMQPELSQEARLLRPILVTALDSAGVARLYCLALAANWVRHTPQGITLTAPDGKSQLLVEHDSKYPVNAYVQGLLKFALNANPDLVRALQEATEKPSPETVSAWQNWLKPDWQFIPLVESLQNDGPDATDLTVILALVVRQHMGRIRPKP